MEVLTPEKPFWFTTRTGILRREKLVVFQSRPRPRPQFELHKTLEEGIIGDESSCVPVEMIDERLRRKRELSNPHNNTVVEVSRMNDWQFELYIDQLGKPKKTSTILWQNHSELFEELAAPLIQMSEVMQ